MGGDLEEKYSNGSTWKTTRHPDGSLTISHEKENEKSQVTYDKEGSPTFEMHEKSGENGTERKSVNHITGITVHGKEGKDGSSTTAFDKSGKPIYHRDDFPDGRYQSTELENDGAIEVTYGSQTGVSKTRIDDSGVETSHFGSDGNLYYNGRQNADGSEYEQALLENGKIRVSYKESTEAKAQITEIAPAPKGSLEAGLTEALKMEGKQVWAKNEWTTKTTGYGGLGCAFSVSEPLVKAGLIKNPQTSVGGLVKELERSGYKQLPSGSKPEQGDVGIGQHQNDSNPYRGGYAHAFYVIGQNSKGEMEVLNNTNRPQNKEGLKSFQREPLENIPYPVKIYYRKAN